MEPRNHVHIAPDRTEVRHSHGTVILRTIQIKLFTRTVHMDAIPPNSPEPGIDKPQGKYQCDYGDCRETFRREKHLDMHLYKHNGQRKHKCDLGECGKSFILAEHLKRHHQTVHGFVEKQQTPCEDPSCGNIYESRAAMKKHFRQKHQSPKTHDCPHCGEKFLKKVPLAKHLYTHTGDYPQKCQLCPVGFLNVRELWAHQEAKHSNNDGKVCDRCNKMFPNWSALVAHRKADHPPRFPCPEPDCGKDFYSRSRLKIHLVTHQRQQDWMTCCQEGCKFKTSTRATLINHIRRNHGDKNFKCILCGTRFAKNNSLTKHMKLIHNVEKSKVKERKPRKDKGIPKPSGMVRLPGVVVKYSSPPAGSCAMEEAAAVAATTSATDTESEATNLVQDSYAF